VLEQAGGTKIDDKHYLHLTVCAQRRIFQIACIFMSQLISLMCSSVRICKYLFWLTSYLQKVLQSSLRIADVKEVNAKVWYYSRRRNRFSYSLLIFPSTLDDAEIAGNWAGNNKTKPSRTSIATSKVEFLLFRLCLLCLGVRGGCW
jgi:hypothetical protein